MGKYINAVNGKAIGSSFEAKCANLKEAGAVPNSGDEYVPNLICVVDNGPFAAAGYAYSESEYDEFARPDGRPRKWFTLENAESFAD